MCVASGLVQPMGNPSRISDSRFGIFMQPATSVVTSGSDFIFLAEVTDPLKEVLCVQLSLQFCHLPLTHHFRPKDATGLLLTLVFFSFPYILSPLLKILGWQKNSFGFFCNILQKTWMNFLTKAIIILWNFLNLFLFKCAISFLFDIKKYRIYDPVGPSHTNQACVTDSKWHRNTEKGEGR